jgi:hypothetical protein
LLTLVIIDALAVVRVLDVAIGAGAAVASHRVLFVLNYY